MLLTGAPLTTHDVESVALSRERVEVAPGVLEALDATRERLLDIIRSGEPYYGVNTGFGALGRVRIGADSLEALQSNLIRSHATGVGDPLPREVVRATMLLLVASLARNHSGVRSEVVRQLVRLINDDIIPYVPEIGSVGASGDLAPLAHIALVLLGEGDVLSPDNHPLPTAELVAEGKLEPITLRAKEGLALINGTHLMAARAALLTESFERLFAAALVAAAMSIDTSRATAATLDARIHKVRCQAGQIQVARRLRAMLRDSEILRSHAVDDPRVQDPYSFRCCPAVLGAAWDAFQDARRRIDSELGAVTDNPLLFDSADDTHSAPHALELISGGNFHGMPLAIPLDIFAISLAHIAGIAERRVYHMLSGADPEAELPTFLTPQAGLQSGLMIAQYTAAACCNELIGLANPASVVNLSTSAGMEDYNSFGPRSAAKAVRGLKLTRSVVAIELLCAATGLDHHRPLKSGATVERAFEVIRQVVPPLEADRSPAPDIRAIDQLIEQGAFTFGLTDSD